MIFLIVEYHTILEQEHKITDASAGTDADADAIAKASATAVCC